MLRCQLPIHNGALSDYGVIRICLGMGALVSSERGRSPVPLLNVFADVFAEDREHLYFA
jgi:hypothetical protein